MKKRLIIGNWKMNPEFVSKSPDRNEMVALAHDTEDAFLNLNLDREKVGVVICPPLIGLQDVIDTVGLIFVGAQNGWPGDTGAVTGEVSMGMIYRSGAQFVIIGHSERRKLQGESDELINQKVKSALEHDITPIVCVGEQEKGSLEGATYQLKKALSGVNVEQIERTVIAYEPVWAIGTGDAATPEYINDVIDSLRHAIKEMSADSSKVRILYGGSVTKENAASYAKVENIDGALVGGASLNIDEFSQIITNFAG